LLKNRKRLALHKKSSIPGFASRVPSICVAPDNAERSHSHRGFSPVIKAGSTFLNRFNGLPKRRKPLKRLDHIINDCGHRAEAPVNESAPR
jgi:hypothetical protein